MTAAGLVLLALAGAYAWRLGRFAQGFRRVARRSDARRALGDDALPTVSVVVPARDEEASIGACLDAILAQDYPAHKLEILAVDDDSSDATPELVRARQTSACGGPGAPEPGPALHLVQIPENRRRARAHKKAAIEKAVARATGELILTTDADCLVPPRWARTMAAAFDAPEVAFVSGPVRYRLRPGAGLFARLQALDFFGLMACGAGGIGLGRPNLANGACVAYRRDVFERLGGFSGIDHVTSGDDELLMQKIAYGAATDGRGALAVRFCADPAATVLTDPVASVRAFVHQRKRWASKGTHYPPQLQRMLIGLVAFFLALTAACVALPFAPALAPWVAAALAVKAAADLAVLVPAARRFGQTRLLAVFPLHLVLHAPHSLVVGILGPLGRFEWKGRSLDR